ncbi:Phosphate-selective porin O and P [Tautonia plasticadhaerens]|uniref:Phosphate-selective porin O and P n=2 Tax=Tautonia plasticadhaerens TaxID=2527974 RepID=A0A518H337_9BACT|nr:Phosphate-selective porin O and P [Tautonia plasticadhaerens]
MSRTPRRGRRRTAAALLVAALAWTPRGIGQEEPAPGPAGSPSVEDRLRRLEELNASLLEQNRMLLDRLDDLSTKYDEVIRVVGPATGTEAPAPPSDPAVEPAQDLGMPPLPGPSPVGPMGEPASPVDAQPDAPRLDSVAPPPAITGSGRAGAIGGYQTQILGSRGEPAGQSSARNRPIEAPFSGEGRFPLEAFYDEGFVLGSDDEDVPFLLKTNVRMQFRHTGFDRSRLAWVDSAGIVRPILERNDFEIERGRLSFEGFFYDPDLQYYLNLDFDTDDQHVVIAQDFWMNYRFNRGLDVYIGKAFVPGSRSWLEGSTRTQFADRSMATTFFRPDRSVGIWALGEPIDKVFYRVMLANGFNTSDLTFEEINEQLAYSGSVWSEVIGEYGRGFSDLEWHDELAVRLGNSFTFAPGSPADIIFNPVSEQDFVRLSDGTPLFETGALAPGVTVEDFDIYLYAVDAALKYRGLSLNAEYYFRWLQDIQADLPLPVGRTRMYDHGYYVQGGYFVARERVELIARHSQVNGPFGSGQEYALGFNWFINRSHYLKFTFDANWLDAIPAQNSGPNYRAGDSGMLFRSQLQVAF